MHSPAPWRVSRVSDYTQDADDTKILGVYAADGKTIIFTDSGYFEPSEENVALIIAAPDLLRVCKRLLAYVEDLEFPTGADAAKDACEVIARAERKKA